MKKQLLAAAVASAIVVPMTAAADVTVYGKLHYSIDSIDYGSDVGDNDYGSGNFLIPGRTIQGTGNDKDIGSGYDGWAVNSHSSRFGIKGSEDLGNGLSAVFQMEFEIAADDLGDIKNKRNTYVALAGSWGVAGIGQVDTPYKSSTGSLELFGDNVGDYNQLGFHDVRAPDAVFYMSPNWNGFSFVGAVVLPSASVDSDGVEATSIAFKYDNGPFFASLAYENVSEEWMIDRDDLDETTAFGVGATALASDDYSKWRLGLGYTANAFHVGFIYEDREMEFLDTSADSSSWQLSASYSFGNNKLKVAYGELEADDDLFTAAGWGDMEAEQWSVGIDHKLSKRTKLYAVYSDYDFDDNGNHDLDWDAFSLGIVHKF